MELDDWYEQFVPLKNPQSEDCSWDGCMYWRHQEDLLAGVDPAYIWTYVDGDGGTYLVSGKRFVNRIGWLVTKVSWKIRYDTEYFEEEICVNVQEEDEEIKI